ncbi:MAG TPA: alpha/beta hydrolase family protein [Acidobacteriaceae bacterium]|jgi:dienelactone hydrolase|nr:alpha/beta hydrolase family protein [Acidobacteriaceae bacterium]
MLSRLYRRWMIAWETALTTRDENRIVRPMEWGFDWLDDFVDASGLRAAVDRAQADPAAAEPAMLVLNEAIVRNSESFYSYERPRDFRLEERHPQLYPTNVRPETLRRDEQLKQRARAGKLRPAQYLRFTSPVRTPYPENDLANARWYPAPAEKQQGKPKRAMIVMPQWNADAFSHNILCSLFNRMGISALRLSKPFHDIRRPAEIIRSDYAVSSNIGRNLAACRQAVVDVRCCLDWLEAQGYEEFGILGTSLGSCYAFIAGAHDARLQVNAFNHASMSFGDVVWTGQSTRHIREAFADAGMTHQQLYGLFAGVSPVSYMERFAANPKKVLVIHARYDLTFLPEYSEQVVAAFAEHGIDFVSKVLPCGHYTTGETPYKFMDGWWMGSFVYAAFRDLPRRAAGSASGVGDARRELVAR